VRAALTVFDQGKEEHSPQSCIREARHTDVQFSVSSHTESTADQSRTSLVKIKENITLALRCRQIVTGAVDSGKGQSLPLLVCVELVQIPIEGIFPTRALSRVEPTLHGVTSQGYGNAAGNPIGSTYVIFAHVSDEPLIIFKATIFGVAEEISV
jgi:hypothetical protein